MAKQHNQKYYRPKPNRNRLYSIILIVVLIGCMYIGVYHSHRYFGFDSNFWLAMISLFSLAGLHTILFDNRKANKFKFAFFILIVGLPLLVFVILMHNSYVTRQFAGYTINVSGVVTELFIRRGKHSHTDYAMFNYKVDHKTITQIVKNEGNRLVVGDTITILCTTADPEVFRLISK